MHSSLFIPVHLRGEIDWPVAAYVAQRMAYPRLRMPCMADLDGKFTADWLIIPNQSVAGLSDVVHILRPDDQPTVDRDLSEGLVLPVGHIDLEPMRIFARYNIDQDRDGVEFMLRYGGEHPTAIPYEFEIPAEIVERDLA